METNQEVQLHSLQNEILEAVARGVEFPALAKILCERAEEIAPGAFCSILIVEEGKILRPVAAPSLPEHYSRALDGLLIGPNVGSCGTAAYLGEAVEVVDIATDSRWKEYASLALPLGLLACWSSPIKVRNGKVAATFAFYYETRRGPTQLERLLVQACVHVCTIALENLEVQRQVRHLAYFDQLTGLPNRASFDQSLATKLAEPSPSFALLLIDIDHLKTINDSMGHLVGDGYIEEIGRRLGNSTQSGTSYRLSGDEFAVLVDPCCDEVELDAFASTILEFMKAPFDFKGNTLVPHVTIGGVAYGLDGLEGEVLRQNADFALYHAKETNRGGYVRFKPGLGTTIRSRIASIREVDQALTERRVFAYYQPVFRLDTKEVVGLEALVRMKTPDGLLVTASTFQAAFSDSKVAYRITCEMLRQVAGDIKTWLARGIPLQHVGVNLAAVDFKRSDLEERLVEAFGAEGVPLKHLILEVTETVLLDQADRSVGRAVERLRARGLLVALDDFGTGYGSLTHLLSLPVDVIKIDKSFVDRLLTDRPNAVIVEGMIDIARKLDIKVVAEGVETQQQAERLFELGCDLGQGYLFGPAADMQTTTDLLEDFAQGVTKPIIQNSKIPIK